MTADDVLTPDDLDDWMKEHAYSVRGLAAELGIAFTTVQRWRNGSVPCPPWLPLALRGISCLARHG